MKRILFRCQVVGVLAAAAFYAQNAFAQDQKAKAIHYTVTDLGVLNSVNPGPLVIENNGLIAETVEVSNALHAAISFLGTTIDLAKTGGLGGPNSAAFGVNERGQAAGAAETADFNTEDFCGFGTQGVCKAFIWQNGVMSALPLLKDAYGVAGKNAAAKGINIFGQVAGVAENTVSDTTTDSSGKSSPCPGNTYQFKPVIWTNGAIQELPLATSDDTDGVVFRINDRGQAVGATGKCTAFTGFSYLNGQHATLWQNGSVIDLGNLGGIAAPPPATGLGSIGNFAYYINRSGHVVGTSGTSDGSFHAFLWTPETLIQDVGTIPANGTAPADVASIGLSINDHGDIGGISFPAESLLAVPTALPRAFIRPNGGTMVDLNSLIPADSALYLFTTCSINSGGAFIGLALDIRGNFHGYLATPSSESGDSSSDLSAASRSAQFGYAWSLASQRMSSPLRGRR